MKRRLLVSSLVALLSAGPALAGIGKGDGEIGFDLGYTEFDQNLTGQNGARLALRGGYHVTRLFQIEGQVAVNIKGVMTKIDAAAVLTLMGGVTKIN